MEHTEDQILLEADSLTCGYGEKPVIHDISLELKRGDFVGVIGPNGCGKSTLIRALTGVLPFSNGRVRLMGNDIRTLSRRQIARQVAVIPQDTVPQFGFSVLEMVLMGRTPHLGRLQRAGEQDMQIALEALQRTDMFSLKDRNIMELSGGEKQRAVIARALAQEPDILLLDEPDSHLDIGHQIEIFDLLKDLNRAQQLTLLCVSHDLNLASAYAGRLVLMQSGSVVATGSPVDILTPEILGPVYGIKAIVRPSPVNGTPQVTPYN
jgi:iron complex transport system ATP-binding protein